MSYPIACTCRCLVGMKLSSYAGGEPKLRSLADCEDEKKPIVWVYFMQW